MAAPIRVLVVGAGAVGQVYARHLQLGGAELTLFVRDRYRAAAERGFDLYVLHGRRPTEPVRLEGCAVVTRPDEVAARRFDQVYLTVSSPALAGPWLGELIAALGDATIVMLQPGPDDHARLIAAGAAPARLVSGLITLIAYAAPLAGETRFPRPGTAYWFPPLAPSPLSGPPDRTAGVIAALRAGKLPAKRHRDARTSGALLSAAVMPYLVALETAGWSLRALTRGAAMARGGRGARQALAIAAVTTGRRAPLGLRVLVRPGVIRIGLWAARPFVPLPLEVYLRAHFTKVHDQTVGFMAGYVADGRRAGLDVTGIEELLAAIQPARAAARAIRG
jgi:hypothetical protein